MSFSPVPRFSFRNLTDVSPDFLDMHGIRLLMLDLDNTIAAYGESSPADEILQWISGVKARGVKLFIISNSKRKSRVEAFAEALDIDYINEARKPSPKVVLAAMKAAGYRAGESALSGDQVYTDALAANRAGVLSITVRPRSLKNPLHALRYSLELPFRAFARKKP